MFPIVEGVPDLRLKPDRYLSLADDRAKAGRLAALSGSCTIASLAEAYYAMTADVDATRRALFLAHLDRAEERGAALDALLPRAGRVLEVGCGSGGLLTARARAGRASVGLDIALRWLIVARRRLNDRGLDAPLFAASAEALPWPDACFDAIVADSLLEHLDDAASALAEFARVLRPGGRLVLWSPNRFSLLADPHVALWGVGWLPRGIAEAYVAMRRGCDWPLRLHSARGAKRLAAAAGFERIRIAPPLLRTSRKIRGQEQGLPLRLYHHAVSMPAARPFLAAFGPLWQLTAVRKGAA